MSIARNQRKAARAVRMQEAWAERFRQGLLGHDSPLRARGGAGMSLTGNPARRSDDHGRECRAIESLAELHGLFKAGLFREYFAALDLISRDGMARLMPHLRLREERLTVEIGSGCGATDSVLLDDALRLRS